MGLTISIGRGLSTLDTPSIMVFEPQPRWLVWAKKVSKLLGLLLLAAGAFFAGTYFEQQRLASAPPKVLSVPHRDASATPPPAVAQPAPQSATTPETKGMQELALRLGLDGLDVQSLEARVDPAVPGRLHYVAEVANTGRFYAGGMEFVVQGLQSGRKVIWQYPSGGQTARPDFQLRISRYLKTEGQLDLPAGLVPQALTLRLHEATGVRASRAVQVTTGPVEASPPAGPTGQ